MSYITSIKNRFDANFGNSYKQKWERYLGTYAPIMYKKSVSALKAESQVLVSSNFISEIVNLKTGYLASKVYQDIMTTEESSERDLEIRERFKVFLESNNEQTMNIESIKQAAASGISHRLMYLRNGFPVLKNLMPWEVIYDYDDDIYNPRAAYYFFSKTDLLGNTKYFCDVYDTQFVTHFISDGGKYIQLGEPEPHLFYTVPIYPFLNNDTIQGQCDKVFDMIDAYDDSNSDFASEIKACRFAYLKIFGQLYTGRDEDGNEIDINSYLRETGAFLFGVDDQGKPVGDASFLEKKLNHESIVALQTELKKHIYTQSDSIDLDNLIAMGSNARIFTVKTALMRLETDASLTERFFRKALMKQFELFTTWLVTYFSFGEPEISVAMNNFNIEFNRVFPEDIDAIVQTLGNLRNSMSLEDAYRYLGFEDAKGLAIRFKEELGLTGGITSV